MSEALVEKPHRRRHFQWLALAATLGAVAWFLAHRWGELGFEWSKFAAIFADLNWAWFAGAVAFALLTYVGRALRWQVLLRPVKADSSLWNIFSATAIGFTAIVFFGRAGEVVRPYLIALKRKCPFSSQVGAWLHRADLGSSDGSPDLRHRAEPDYTSGATRRATPGVGAADRRVHRRGVLALLCLMVLVLVSRFSRVLCARDCWPD